MLYLLSFLLPFLLHLTDPVEIHPITVERHSPEFYENQVIAWENFLENGLFHAAVRFR